MKAALRAGVSTGRAGRKEGKRAATAAPGKTQNAGKPQPARPQESHRRVAAAVTLCGHLFEHVVHHAERGNDNRQGYTHNG